MYRSELVVFFLITLSFINQYQSTPLDDYVHAPDPHFNWTLIYTYVEPDYKLYILNFTSQKWLDETFSSRSIWWHYLGITIPNNIRRSKSALLFIGGGSNTDSIPKPTDESVSLISMLAVGTGSITADLQDIPNVPIRFSNDPTNQTRNDNSALAWTWKTFINNPSNPDALLHLPMTKAAIRAMDVVQQFAIQLGITAPETFVVSGASKRGWTTWTAAAVDTKRIIGIIPIVMDLMNLQANLHHLYRSLIGWTFALKDFYKADIFPFLDTNNFTQMAQIIDPFIYFDRYATMKTLQIQTTGDEFFLPDNEDAFWRDLQRATGGTYLRRIPNAEHQCVGHLISIFFTMQSFYLSIYENERLPSLQWSKSSNNTHGYIRAIVDFSVGPKPINATGYRARTLNDRRRDFRLFIGDPADPTKPKANPVIWFTTPLVTTQNNTHVVYSLSIERPFDGWEGFFIQVNFPGPLQTVLELTTEMQVIPDTYPTADCQNESCAGTLV